MQQETKIEAGGKTSRRQFLKTGAAAVAALGFPAIVPSSVFGANAPNNRINVAFIGSGNQGFVDMKEFIQNEDMQIVAVCDVNTAGGGYKTSDQFLGREPARKFVDDNYGKKTRSGNFKGCDAYKDFRDVLARKDVDAVVVVVPDHWHAVISIMAADAGKDIYCEKPMSLTVKQGRAMIEAVRRNNVVFQTGSHQRSFARNRRVCELVRNGYIGDLKRIVALVGPNSKDGPKGDWKPDPVPEGFDYDMWLGPAPWAPYHRDRCFYRFRFIMDYSGGQTTNYGAHSLDMGMWGGGFDRQGPVEVEDLGGEYPKDGLYTTPSLIHFRCVFANGVELICKTGLPDVKVTFEGTTGWINANADFNAEPKSLNSAQIKPNQAHLYESNNHCRNFLECIRTRKDPITPVEVGHSSAIICHLGNIAMLLKRKLKWDAAKEEFVGDDEANRMLSRPMRAPWNII